MQLVRRISASRFFLWGDHLSFSRVAVGVWGWEWVRVEMCFSSTNMLKRAAIWNIKKIFSLESLFLFHLA